MSPTAALKGGPGGNPVRLTDTGVAVLALKSGIDVPPDLRPRCTATTAISGESLRREVVAAPLFTRH